MPEVASREVPTFSEFNPDVIPMQKRVINRVFQHDYSKDKLEVLMSGSIGSAKSIVLAHLCVLVAMMYPGARIGIGRDSMDDIKNTLFGMILDHMESDFREGVDFTSKKKIIEFSNGSTIECFSWHDKRYAKFRSYSFCMFVIEELTENITGDPYEAIKMRVGRQINIPFALIVSATNPDEPDHWAYEYFIEGSKTHENIEVFYSYTKDNPFLPSWYYSSLQKTFSKKMADRMLRGQWVRIVQKNIYYSFDTDRNVIRSSSYQKNPDKPLLITFDFNIGKGKPMSAALLQENDNGQLVQFDEVILDGMRTLDVMDEIEARGYLEFFNKIIVYGDRNGANNDTRGTRSDYDLIIRYLEKYERMDGSTPFKKKETIWLKVPLSNPSVRMRHNKVNASFQNDAGEVSLLITDNCTTTIKGFKLTALKPGADYVEDDSKPYQHVTTAVGYCVVSRSKTPRQPRVQRH